jgi:hypothetical protein
MGHNRERDQGGRGRASARSSSPSKTASAVPAPAFSSAAPARQASPGRLPLRLPRLCPLLHLRLRGRRLGAGRARAGRGQRTQHGRPGAGSAAPACRCRRPVRPAGRVTAVLGVASTARPPPASDHASRPPVPGLPPTGDAGRRAADPRRPQPGPGRLSAGDPTGSTLPFMRGARSEAVEDQRIRAAMIWGIFGLVGVAIGSVAYLVTRHPLAAAFLGYSLGCVTVAVTIRLRQRRRRSGTRGPAT